jgi:hypothetical protein
MKVVEGLSGGIGPGSAVPVAVLELPVNGTNGVLLVSSSMGGPAIGFSLLDRAPKHRTECASWLLVRVARRLGSRV